PPPYPLSLHDALPICSAPSAPALSAVRGSSRISTSPLHPVPSPHTSSSSDRPSYVITSAIPVRRTRAARSRISPSRHPLLRSPRSEEHTSELQSPYDL